MNLDVKKVVVVGGGSAGWMSAATIAKLFPEMEVTVIESPNIPTVGVGESTLGGINVWLDALGIEEKDFIKDVDGSLKLSIKFTDFYDVDSGSFHYPFGSPLLGNAAMGLNTWNLKRLKLVDEDIQPDDYARTWVPQMALVERNRYGLNVAGEFDHYNPIADTAYHFDAVKFGLWLRDNFCKKLGVEHVQDTVEKVNTDESGVSSLVLASGQEISADLYIDCSGFKSILLSGALEEPFISYEHILPNNRAWAAQIPYTDKEKELEIYTNCTALGHGWAWNTPLWSRIGTGYVYSDKFVSPEEALEEFKNYLNSDKMALHNPNRVTEEVKFRDIQFKVGTYPRIWVKNVVAIGLASGFIEPLESNGLFSVHVYLLRLVKALRRERISKWDRDTFNSNIKLLFDDLAAFVALHYTLSVRRDTNYWRAIAETTYDDDVEYPAPKVGVGFQDLAYRRMDSEEYNTAGGIHYIATGLRYYAMDEEGLKRRELVNPMIDHDYLLTNFLRERQRLMAKWEAAAEASPTLYEYLKGTYYG